MAVRTAATICDLSRDLSVDLVHQSYRFLVRSWELSELRLESDATHFGFASCGTARLESKQGRFDLRRGMYFSLPSSGTIRGMPSPGAEGSAPQGLLISQFRYRGLFQLGGPIEKTGRLNYIDGCSDTLLLSPVVRGDACLNFLYLPPKTNQTAHTHSSFRVGVVVSGGGSCHLQGGISERLRPGTMFVLHRDCIHRFRTAGEPMRIVAFHPDSDFGPWHNDHPMINRTYIQGVSATKNQTLDQHLQ